MMLPSHSFRPLASLLLLAVIAASQVSASEAGKLLSAETDMILTLNVRQILDDHKGTEIVQRFLEPWRLAVAGDEKRLSTYYQAHEVLKAAGITEQEFLKHASQFKSINDALGLDLLQDIDRITCGFKIGAGGGFTVIVEGRFKEEKFRTEPQEVKGLHLGLLNARILAIASSKKALDDVRSQDSGKKQGGPAPRTRTLLDRGKKEHVAFIVNNVDGLVNAAAKYLTDEVATKLDPGNAAGKAVVNQVAAALRKHGPGITGASLGLSIGAEDSRLQFGLVTVKPEIAADFGAMIGQSNLLAALALKTVNNELARQLADILLRVRVHVKDTTLLVRTRVPHEFLQEVGKVALLKFDALSLRVTSIPLWRPLQPQPPGALEVEEHRDIAYRDDAKANPLRHRLDLYLPRGKKDYPIVVLVHGGSWIVGDNRCCGLYSTVGHFLASQGIGTVMPNYRLSPGVKHPSHVEDVARVVRWVHDNAAQYGANPKRIFLLGHSAGGHLVSLLATDETYLKAEGLTAADIKGVITVSGVYRIPSEPLAFSVGGTGPGAFQPCQLYPLRGEGSPLPNLPYLGISFKADIFAPVFGDDPKERARASPLTHVRRGLPPFLILSAEKDLPTLAGMADEFHQALVREGCDARLLKIEKRNHDSILFSAIGPDDLAARTILEFLGKHDRKK
jgi:acetyl esterase/lipase